MSWTKAPFVITLVCVCLVLAMGFTALWLRHELREQRAANRALATQLEDAQDALSASERSRKAADEAVTTMMLHMEAYRDEMSKRTTELEELREESPAVDDWCSERLPDELLCKVRLSRSGNASACADPSL